MTATVVIVGAGSAGLAAGAALRRRGINPVILERGGAVATSWRHRHEDLRLNTVRWLSGLPGLRIPRVAGRWVRRDDYIAYLERFARHEQLDIRFGVHARRIDPIAGGWQVTTDNGAYPGEHVIVATGHDRIPRLPDWPGRAGFHPPIRHVSGLRRAADLAGARVLLVGAGNSGVDIAGHLVDAGVAQLWVSVRHSPTILPRQLHGVPLHPLTVALRWLPERLRDRVALAIAHHAFGDLTGYGLPPAPSGPFERMRRDGVTVAIDQGFVAHLAARRLQIVAPVERLDDREVVLVDGTRVRPDVVVTATGYHPGLTDLVGHLDILDRHRRPRPGRSVPGLWFIGYQPAIEGNLRQHPGEARRIARAISTAQRTQGPRRSAQTHSHTTAQQHTQHPLEVMMAIRHVTPIPRKLAVGRVAEVYAQSVAEFGQAAFMMLSPAPDLHAAAWALLREAELAGNAPRVDKEVVAVAVSHANRCRFCIDAHTILIHALGEHQLAEDLLADNIPAQPEQAALVAWAKATRVPSGAQLPPPPFPAALSAEYLGTALSTHFINRMFSALTDEQLLPGNLQRSRSVRRVGALAYTRVVHRDLAPGESLPLLDGAPMGQPPAWAAGTPIGTAFAALRGAAASAGTLLSASARHILRATVAEWDGTHLPPHGAWPAQAMAGLPDADQPATKLALLAALAPHHISDADVAAWRATGKTTDGDLVRLLAFGAITAVDRIADTLASVTATR